MQTRHPRQYGPDAAGVPAGQVFEESDTGLTMRARPVNPEPAQAFRGSVRGGATLSLGALIPEDDFFTTDPVTGGVKINPDLLP